MTEDNTDARKNLLSTPKKFAETEFEVEGSKVLIRKPTIRERNELQQMAITTEDGEAKFDGLAFRVHAIISCCIDPVTRKPVFERSDYQNLLEYPTGSWVDKLSEKLEEVLYVNTEKTKKD